MDAALTRDTLGRLLAEENAALSEFETLLDREHLFTTEPARQLWDAAARANLARELQSLA